MKNKVIHHNVKNPNLGTAWESLNDSTHYEQIIEGQLHIDGQVATIYNKQQLVFCANITNVTITPIK